MTYYDLVPRKIKAFFAILEPGLIVVTILIAGAVAAAVFMPLIYAATRRLLRCNRLNTIGQRRPNSAFTLFELIGVLAIISIILAMVAPMTLQMLKLQRQQADKAALPEIAQALKLAMLREQSFQVLAHGGTWRRVMEPVVPMRFATAIISSRWSADCILRIAF